MRASAFLPLALLVLASPALRADDPEAPESAKLEYSFFYGASDEKTLEKWVEAVRKERELGRDEDLGDPKLLAELREVRAALKSLTAAMGAELKVEYLLIEQALRANIGPTQVVVVRFDAEVPHVATYDTKKPNATKIAITALKGNAFNENIKCNFDGLSGKKKDILGYECLDYKVNGGLKGSMWISEVEKRALSVTMEFCEIARGEIGGFKGEPLWCVIDGAQHFPVIAIIGGMDAGITFAGTPQNRTGAYAMVLRQITHFKKGKGPVIDFDVPAEKKVKEVGFPKK